MHILESFGFIKYRSNKLQPRLTISAPETRNGIVRVQKAYRKLIFILRHSVIRRQRKGGGKKIEMHIRKKEKKRNLQTHFFDWSFHA